LLNAIEVGFPRIRQNDAASIAIGWSEQVPGQEFHPL
jgi:hypothetical protein